MLNDACFQDKSESDGEDGHRSLRVKDILHDTSSNFSSTMESIDFGRLVIELFAPGE